MNQGLRQFVLTHIHPLIGCEARLEPMETVGTQHHS